MKKMEWYAGVCVLLFAEILMVLAGQSHAGSKGGEWEGKTTIEMPGMPFAIPPTVMRYCMEDQAVPYRAKSDEKCETVTKKVSGNAVTWKVRCQGENGPMEMEGVTKYTGDTMESNVKMRSEDGDMSMRMSGKKLGPCK